MPPLLTPLRVAVLGGLAALGATAALAFSFQDTIGLALINPNRSYEAYTPPDPPSYEAEDAWLARGDGGGAADIFFIHANVYSGDGNWNAPYDRQTQLPLIRDTLLPLEAGPFAAYGRLWAPRYRQPTLYARFTQKHPGAAARATAYGDILRAFEVFMAERDRGRPFIVVGYGDGALLAGRIYEEVIANRSALKAKMAALYAIGMPLPAAMFEEKTCQSPDEARCVVAFVPVDSRFKNYRERLRSKTLTLAPGGGFQPTSAGKVLCAPPPLPARVSAAFVHKGELLSLTTDLDVACEEGLLTVEPPRDRRLRQQRFFGAQWRPDDVNLFYEPLREDAGRRLEAVMRRLAREANEVPPLSRPEDVSPAVINTVPKEKIR